MNGTATGRTISEEVPRCFRPSSFRRQDICRARWTPSDEANSRNANEVRLTILVRDYDNVEDAVALLESTVATGGPGDWVEGVGDRAFQNETSLQVAAKAKRFTVSVLIAGDPAGTKSGRSSWRASWSITCSGKLSMGR